MKTFKRHLTVANVLSIVAVFIALSATAVAATKIGPGQVKAVNLANQSVTNPKIKTQAVTSGKIKNLGIVSGDLAANSVVSSKIAKKAVTNAKLGTEAVGANKLGKNSVTNAKIGSEAVTTGKIGNESINAAKMSASLYAQLVKNVSYFTAESASNNTTAKSAEISCPVGKQAIGGGARVNGELQDVAVTGSNPAVTAGLRTGWQAYGRDVDTTTTTGNWSVEAFVVCAEL